MSDYEPPSARYRRLATECLEVGSTFPLGDRRTVLMQMAQVWQRLADEYQGSTPPLLRPDAGASPTLQQQQQRQPKGDGEESSRVSSNSQQSKPR